MTRSERSNLNNKNRKTEEGNYFNASEFMILVLLHYSLHLWITSQFTLATGTASSTFHPRHSHRHQPQLHLCRCLLAA